MEVIAAQGFPSDTVLSADFAAIGHAVLGLLKVHTVLGSSSPFIPMANLPELALKIESPRCCSLEMSSEFMRTV